jgi:hypothetical protein
VRRMSRSWAAASSPQPCRAGLLDEIVLHQVPVLLGAGRSFFGELPEHVQLTQPEVAAAPGVTHLKYEVVR